ncbi:hypothetical protein [Flavobacterium sp. C4GT6]|uniref:hypothetical protein n=1 Tax=Flavobacterium sp. C4GT6 TaxID=3103818 RepID=UPI002ED4D0C5
MKATLTTLLFFLCFTATKAQQFKISYDTIPVNLKGSLRRAIFFKDKYYCFTDSDNLPYSSDPYREFYILSREGKELDNITVHDKMNTLNFDFYAVNDTVIIKTDNYTTFYLDEVNRQWHKHEAPYNLVFENKKYMVNYLYYGEWGENLWFFNKKTGTEYEVATNTENVIEHKGVYYLVSIDKILSVDDPEKLKPVTEQTSYKAVVEKGEIYTNTSEKGLKLLYETGGDKWFKGPHIATSFIYRNKLHHFIIDDKSAVIATLNDGKMDTVQHFTLNEGNEKIKNKYSLINVDGDTINLVTLVNTYSEKLLTDEQDMEVFTSLLNYNLKSKGAVYLDKIEQTEEGVGAVNKTQKHKISIGKDYYPNKENFILETPRIYIKATDLGITISSHYYYTEQDKSIKTFLIKWKSDNEEVMDYKFEELFSLITNSVGQPFSTESGERMKACWKKDGVTMFLKMISLGSRSEINFWTYKE